MKLILIVIVCLVYLVQARNHKLIPRDFTVPSLIPPSEHNTRVTNGVESPPHAFPFAVALTIDLLYLCGGSIITKKVVLTAAHCVTGSIVVQVQAGAHNIYLVEPTQQNKLSTQFIVHENWDPNTASNDIALVVLLLDLQLNVYVNISPLDEGSCPTTALDGRNGTVIGWGRTSDSSSTSAVIRNTTNPILTKAKCQEAYSVPILDTEVCLDGSNNRSACNGDSGGALLSTRYNGGPVVQVGIVSFGSNSGCTAGAPSVYTRVACYISWIQSKLATIG